MANRNPLVLTATGSLGELTAGDTLNVPGSLVVNGVPYAPGFVPGGVQAPSAVVFDHADYAGSTEYITWRANNAAAPSAGAIEFYGWQDSPDGTTWGTETFHGDTYQGSALTSGNQYARVRAYPLVTNGGTATPSGWVTSAAVAYTTGLVKRRFALTFYPASTTADTVPNITQSARLPKGSNNTSSNWKLMSAILRVETPNASATTAQVYYVSNPGNAAFGSGTAALSSALSAAGTTVYESSTSTFTGTLASVGLASGSILAPQFSALGGSKVSLFTEWEEV